MKKISIFFALLCAVVFATGCAKEAMDAPGRTVLKASMSSMTRTAIDGVKVSWTPGDAICVNGANSYPLTEGGATANFEFRAALTAPYKAVYPTSIYKDATTVTLPLLINMDSFSVPLSGYLAEGDEITFKAMTALIKLSITGESTTTVRDVTLKGLGGEQISGDFTIDYETGAITGASDGEACKAVKVNVGKALSSTPLVVYIPIPAGEYPSGYQIDIIDTEGGIMRNTVSARTISAGQLRQMPETAFEPNYTEDPVIGGIPNAEEFLAFASAVNEGRSTKRWENEEGWINLLDDIDFDGVTMWTPVGHATAPWASYNPQVTTGNPFTGKFDGNAHHIKNLKLTDAETVEGRHFGIFGYLGPGAVVQNFVIDETCSLTVTSSVSHSAGLIAGVAYDASVRDVTSYAPMSYSGGCTGYLHMALIGGIYAMDAGCTVDSVHNYGKMTVTNTANLNAGATAIHCAGIVGFANAPTGNEKRNRIAECNNNGDMVSQAGRQAGVVAAANACTDILNCENRGNQTNSMNKNDGTRLGNICCYTTSNSSIQGCKNYGNLISTTGGRVGGIVSLPNAGVYENNENYGEIISDSDYRGVFWGYVTQAAAWSGGKASGKVGKYNNGDYQYDVYPESEKVKYLGKDGSSGKCTVTNVIIDIATGETPVNPDPELDVDADFRIFFIGNSFTKDAVEHLPGILAAAGLNRIQMVHMYYGGRTIPEYNDGWLSSSDYHCYVCNPGQTSWTDITGKTLASIAATGKWDVVTIQEHTGRQLAWGWTGTEKTAVQGLVDKVKAAQTANGANPKLYYILSQAYHDLSKAQNVTKPFTDTDGMWTVIAEQGQHAVEECGFDGVISTGAMLQNLRTSGLNNSLGLTRDGYHMDYGIARYGASCTVFETVIGPFNGNVKLDDNTYRTVGDSEGTTAITDSRAPIALKAARYAIAKPYEVTDMEGEGGDGPEQPVEPDNISIASAADLVAFAARVNSGDKAAIIANVTLTADIDCSSITEWTPIGNCTLPTWAHNSVVTSGVLFTGTFDGQNHSIKNLHLNFSPTAANGAYGLFGGIGAGGTVKNIVFDSSCSMNISTGKAGVFGMLAGLVLDANIDNVSSSAPITGGGTSALANNNASGRVAVGGIVGWAHAVGEDITLSNLLNAGSIGSSTAEFSRGGNGGNGANGFMLGGVVGFSSNNGTTKTQTLLNLRNDADIYTNAGRVSGIVSTANRYTLVKGAENNGDVHYSGSGTFRPANITCIAGEGVVLENCVNRGDLIAPSCASAAGVICLINHANVSITGCKSLGATIVCTGIDIEAGKVTYAGALYGSIASAATGATFSACSVSGKVGKSTDALLTLTAENYFPYVGAANASCATATSSNITFAE